MSTVLRYHRPLAVGALALGAMFLPVQTTPTAPPVHTAWTPDEVRAVQIVNSETNRAAAGRPCINPEWLTDYPETVLISRTTGKLVATSVEEVSFVEGWMLAEDGKAVVRCAIV